MNGMENSWIIFTLDGRDFGVETKFVQEMAIAQSASQIPNSPPYVRGVTNLRGNVFPVVDMRRLLGFKSLVEELKEQMAGFAQRKQDHIKWIAELRASVEENREFRLTTNPHACAFGKWYDHFHASDPVLNMSLMKFDSPHKRIHKIGESVCQLVKEGHRQEALDMIARAWDTDLHMLIDLFDQTLPMFEATVKEIVLVAKLHGATFGAIVDAVTEVCDIHPEKIQTMDAVPMPEETRELISGIGRTDQGLKTLLDGERLFSRLTAYAA
ncbi:MAG: hypothetical protein C4523_08015 [Myxococcales bacterium]|nr:MAG: hypothetical protein C4523_08015 [Myxococcales bacterium]